MALLLVGRRQQPCCLFFIAFGFLMLGSVFKADGFHGNYWSIQNSGRTKLFSLDRKRADGIPAAEATIDVFQGDDAFTSLTKPPPEPHENQAEDEFFQKFRHRAPTQLQHFIRDSGILRAIMDFSVPLGVPSLLEKHPSALGDFLRLTNKAHWINFLPEPYATAESKLMIDDFRVQKLQYGSNSRQILYLSEPGKSRTESEPDRLVVFVHGGAWGSGFPEMYQLAATPFLNEGFPVAVVGYRTFPTADCRGQVDDVTQAIRFLEETMSRDAPSPDLTLVGHSTGSHISSLALATGRLAEFPVDRFVALAGVFDIPEHYAHEKTRGVERVSPLASACGVPGDRLRGWKENSPVRLIDGASALAVNGTSRFFPKTLFLHGELDTTVPYRASQRMSQALDQQQQGCESEFRLLSTVGHADMVTDLMFGGKTRDVVMNWITKTQNEFC